jgi:hypothetical protein
MIELENARVFKELEAELFETGSDTQEGDDSDPIGV